MISVAWLDAVERTRAGQHLVGDHAERVDVGRGRHLFAAQLLGRRIGQRAEEELRIGQPRLIARAFIAARPKSITL